MTSIYVLRYKTCGEEYISCYSSMVGIMSRLKMVDFDNSPDTYDSITITRQEVVTDFESKHRLQTFMSLKSKRDADLNAPFAE